MPFMGYGMSTRTIASPLGVKARFAKGVKYVPLSMFFLRKKMRDDDDDAVFGLEEPKEKGAAPKIKRRRMQAAESLDRYSPQRCMYCDQRASRALVYAGGKGYVPCCKKHVNKGSMWIWRTLKEKITARRRIPKKHKLKEGQTVAHDEGMTSTGTVATTAVPIGPGIRRISDVLDFAPGHPLHVKRKKRKKKGSWDTKVAALLRRVV